MKREGLGIEDGKILRQLVDFPGGLELHIGVGARGHMGFVDCAAASCGLSPPCCDLLCHAVCKELLATILLIEDGSPQFFLLKIWVPFRCTDPHRLR